MSLRGLLKDQIAGAAFEVAGARAIAERVYHSTISGSSLNLHPLGALNVARCNFIKPGRRQVECQSLD